MNKKYEVWILRYEHDNFLVDEELASFSTEDEAVNFAREQKLTQQYDDETETRIQVEIHYQEWEDAGCDQCEDVVYEDSAQW